MRGLEFVDVHTRMPAFVFEEGLSRAATIALQEFAAILKGDLALVCVMLMAMKNEGWTVFGFRENPDEVARVC